MCSVNSYSDKHRNAYHYNYSHRNWDLNSNWFCYSYFYNDINPHNYINSKLYSLQHLNAPFPGHQRNCMGWDCRQHGR